jgi:Tfp pilus assembly protein PilN
VPAGKNKVNINLIVKKEASFSNQLLSWALTYGRYIIIITQIIVLTVFFTRFKLDRDHTDLKESVSQKQALIESVASLETEIRRIQKNLADIKQVTANQNIPLNILRFLSEITPTNTTFSQISFAQNTIDFSATAENLRSFNFFLRKLQQDNKFSEVTLEDIARKPDGRIEFKIKAEINPKDFI